MCLLAIYFKAVAGAPVLIAANREEAYARPSLPPAIQPGEPAVLCGRDAVAGGTWLGVNRYGLAVAVTNRPKSTVPLAPRSRGLLCRDLLAQPNADAAGRMAADELRSGHYAGANYVCIDRTRAWAIHGGDHVEEIKLAAGLHLLTNGNLDDAADVRIALARCLFEERPPANAAAFIQRSSQVCSYLAPTPETASIIVRLPHAGTVSSTLIALTDSPASSIYCHAPGSPDRVAYGDYSAELISILG